jgi:hypothetical protein
MKYWNYLKILMHHKWCVFLEACKLGIPWMGLKHDASKFLPFQFIEYARIFGDPNKSPRGKDGTYDANKVSPTFAYAWLDHQHRSKHHPEYWISWSKGVLVPLKIPEKYLKEMLADMRGAARSIGKASVLDHYTAHRNKYVTAMHEESRLWLEEQIGYTDGGDATRTISKEELIQKVATFAETNWIVRELLDIHKSYDNLPQHIKNLLDKEFGITRVEVLKVKV